MLLTGCLSNNGLGSAATAHENIYGLAQVQVGMTEAEVLKIMSQPYKQKSLEYEGNEYDFWFYITRPVGLGQAHLVRQNLTPLTFENGILIGLGFDHYDYVIAETRKPKEEKITPKATEEHKETESKSIEKALKSMKETGEKPPSESPSLRKAFDPRKHPPIPQSSISMSAKPSVAPKEEEAEESSPLDDEDRKMLEEENEQNFDFW